MRRQYAFNNSMGFCYKLHKQFDKSEIKRVLVRHAITNIILAINEYSS